ncbi:MAG: hypothetical protein QM535_06045 [Limnohabitans sp.]|nr:hypothetical protein [Limnohabitans sp.]
MEQEGIFGIYQYGDGPEGSYIRANKEGLQLYAIELLKGAIAMDEKTKFNETNAIPMCDNGNWMDLNSTIVIGYIESVDKIEGYPSQPNSKLSVKDTLIPYGCGIIVIISIIALIVGFVSIVKWIFNY